MCGLHDVWCLFQGDWYVLYLLVLDCRGGGLYVVCAKSVAVTLLLLVHLSLGLGNSLFLLASASWVDSA